MFFHSKTCSAISFLKENIPTIISLIINMIDIAFFYIHCNSVKFQTKFSKKKNQKPSMNIHKEIMSLLLLLFYLND